MISFMIATPETGADSIPVTYALMGPVMAVIRPLAAFVTALTAGLLENRYGKEPAPEAVSMANALPATAAAAAPLGRRLRNGLRFAFMDLLGDIGPAFAVGVLMAGAIAAWVPASLVSGYLGNPLLAMPVMLLVSLPMYVCATASTPIAAALVLKGLSPGAALVFLLAGPATNVASLSMVATVMGRRSTAIYLAAIIGCSLALGVATDLVYGALGIAPEAALQEAAELIPDVIKKISAVVLLAMIAPSLARFALVKLTPKTI